MKAVSIIYVLYKIGLLSPLGLFRLVCAVLTCGVNVMALLNYAQRSHSDRIALTDDRETLTYRQLLLQSEKLCSILKEEYKLKKGCKVGLLCKNHASLVKSVFAVSLIGADIYLLNAEMSSIQFNDLLMRYDFDFLVHDFELNVLIERSGYSKGRIYSYHEDLPAVNNLCAIMKNETRLRDAENQYIGFSNDKNSNEKVKPKRASLGKIILLTGGTTGNSKTAAHKPSVFNYLNPFITLVARLKLLKYKTVYIATPIYHGYGIAILFLFMELGKKIVISCGFEAEKACRLIREHNVEVVTVVPLMVHRMLKANPKDLKSLSRIISGGAALSPKLVKETSAVLGDILCNMYGTSEAGLNMVASPEDLKYSADTIGRRINGVRLKILDRDKKEVKTGSIGQFCIKNRWSMKNSTNKWIATGDQGYCDDKGYYYLCGRVDDMIVSAGENVYPLEVEKVIASHPEVEDVAVIGVNDEQFGQRLKAFVQPVMNSGITKDELTHWLSSKVARYQMPKDIVFLENMPYTPLGKLDRKQLKQKETTNI